MNRFSRCGERRLLSSCGAWASRCGGFFCCRSTRFRARELQQLWLQGSKAWAQELWCMGLWHMASSWTGDLTCVPCFGRWILSHWTTREVLPTVFCSVVLCVKMYFWFELNLIMLQLHYNSLRAPKGRQNLVHEFNLGFLEFFTFFQVTFAFWTIMSPSGNQVVAWLIRETSISVKLEIWNIKILIHWC